MAFEVVQKGRKGYEKVLASSPFIDIAQACLLGIARRQWPEESWARESGSGFQQPDLVVRDTDTGDEIMKVELVRDRPRWAVVRLD